MMAIVQKLRLCINYILLKEDEYVSSAEKFVFIMKLIRLVDDKPSQQPSSSTTINHHNIDGELNQPVQGVSSPLLLMNDLAECRKKLKLLLLEDIYALNKIEKNWLQMSLVRKQQADLLEWIPLNG